MPSIKLYVIPPSAFVAETVWSLAVIAKNGKGFKVVKSLVGDTRKFTEDLRKKLLEDKGKGAEDEAKLLVLIEQRALPKEGEILTIPEDAKQLSALDFVVAYLDIFNPQLRSLVLQSATQAEINSAADTCFEKILYYEGNNSQYSAFLLLLLERGAEPADETLEVLRAQLEDKESKDAEAVKRFKKFSSDNRQCLQEITSEKLIALMRLALVQSEVYTGNEFSGAWDLQDSSKLIKMAETQTQEFLAWLAKAIKNECSQRKPRVKVINELLASNHGLTILSYFLKQGNAQDILFILEVVEVKNFRQLFLQNPDVFLALQFNAALTFSAKLAAVSKQAVKKQKAILGLISQPQQLDDIIKNATQALALLERLQKTAAIKKEVLINLAMLFAGQYPTVSEKIKTVVISRLTSNPVTQVPSLSFICCPDIDDDLISEIITPEARQWLRILFAENSNHSPLNVAVLLSIAIGLEDVRLLKKVFSRAPLYVNWYLQTIVLNAHNQYTAKFSRFFKEQIKVLSQSLDAKESLKIAKSIQETSTCFTLSEAALSLRQHVMPGSQQMFLPYPTFLHYLSAKVDGYSLKYSPSHLIFEALMADGRVKSVSCEVIPSGKPSKRKQVARKIKGFTYKLLADESDSTSGEEFDSDGDSSFNSDVSTASNTSALSRSEKLKGKLKKLKTTLKEKVITETEGELQEQERRIFHVLYDDSNKKTDLFSLLKKNKKVDSDEEKQIRRLYKAYLYQFQHFEEWILSLINSGVGFAIPEAQLEYWLINQQKPYDKRCLAKALGSDLDPDGSKEFKSYCAKRVADVIPQITNQTNLLILAKAFYDLSEGDFAELALFQAMTLGPITAELFNHFFPPNSGNPTLIIYYTLATRDAAKLNNLVQQGELKPGEFFNRFRKLVMPRELYDFLKPHLQPKTFQTAITFGITHFKAPIKYALRIPEYKAGPANQKT